MSNFRDLVGTQIASASAVPQSPYPPPIAVDKERVIADPKRWAVSDGVYWGAPPTVERIDPGVYMVGYQEGRGPVLMKKDIVTDGLIELPDPATGVVLREFETFWSRREIFKAHGFLHKRGYLLWGPPGSGKTSALQLMMRKLVAAGGIVLLVDHPGIATLCVALLRKIEPDRPTIVVLEDIDAIVQRYGEAELLALLDGESQIDGVVYLATTNYPERLDKRFVDRPSRFDTITYFGMPSAAARAMYFKAKDKALAEDEAEVQRWVRKSQGFSVAHLREMLVAVRCLDQDLDHVVKRLEELHERKPTSEDTPDRKAFGFARGLNGNGEALSA